jgi:hypothetical protein
MSNFEAQGIHKIQMANDKVIKKEETFEIETF